MKIINALFLILISSYSLAQTSIGLTAEPSYQITRIAPSESVTYDSLKALKTIDKTLGFGIEFRNQLDRYQAISFSPGFYQANFHHTIENLQFLDIVHPQLPEIRDLSQAASKDAYLHYRFKYFSARFMYHNKLKGLDINSGLSLDLGVGLSYLYMLQHDLKVRTEGFAINDEFVHIIEDSTGFTGRTHQANLNLGVDLNYRMAPTVYLISGVLFNIPILSTTINNPKLSIFAPGLKFGIRKEL
jgi:hypothetical protein